MLLLTAGVNLVHHSHLDLIEYIPVMEEISAIEMSLLLTEIGKDKKKNMCQWTCTDNTHSSPLQIKTLTHS